MKLYKYYALNGLNLTAVINRQFWASKPGSFNDPYDTPVRWIKKQGGIVMQAVPQSDGTASLKPIAGRRRLDPQPFEPEEIEKVRNMGIICFTTEYDNLLMWSHYADQHRGFVLEFEIPDDAIEFGMFPRLIKVDYEPKEIIAVEGNRYVDAARYKEKSWEYEQEVRFVVDEGNKLYNWIGLKNDWFDIPRGILFGARSDEPSINALTKILRFINPNVERRKAELSENAFKLNFLHI
jgi:hypothetical protein